MTRITWIFTGLMVLAGCAEETHPVSMSGGELAFDAPTVQPPFLGSDHDAGARRGRGCPYRLNATVCCSGDPRRGVAICTTPDGTDFSCYPAARPSGYACRYE